MLDKTTIYEFLKYNSSVIQKILRHKEKYYKTFTIKQKSGKTRYITAPVQELKLIQKIILKYYLEEIKYSKFAKAYKKYHSIKDNAKFHQDKEVVICLDIKGFFDSVRSETVKNIFQEDFSKEEAETLTELCTYKCVLPQGGVTSPYISNIIMHNFDRKIADFCCFLHDKLNYTRYADDITISIDFTHTTSKNGKKNVTNHVVKYIKKILYEHNFELNAKKIKIQYFYQQQKVTGIIVNDFMQVPKKYRMKIRQEIYYIQKYGLESHLMKIKETKEKYINKLKGKINYVLFINPKDTEMKKYLFYINRTFRH